MDKTAYFISDAHLGIHLPGFDNRQNDLFHFFDYIQKDAKELFIVGDLFDFWIEYSHAIRPDYFLVLSRLQRLVESGISVHYLTGNHDFAFGSFLSNILGLHIHHNHLDIEIQNKKVHLYHGDGLLKKDVGYRILKRILRNSLNQKLYRFIHPNIGVPLGTFFSGSSRKMLANFITEDKLNEYRENAKLYLQKSDIIIFGHTHKPEISYFGDKVYVNTGEWIKKYTFAKMVAGKISLWQWKDNDLIEIASRDSSTC